MVQYCVVSGGCVCGAHCLVIVMHVPLVHLFVEYSCRLIIIKINKSLQASNSIMIVINNYK